MSTHPVRHEIAHLAHAELLTPDLDGSLWFFRTLLGMRETARVGDSVHLRCYEDPYHHSLTLTAAEHPGLGRLGWRTTSREALERRATALDRAGLGAGYGPGGVGVGETFRFTSPDGHPMELVWDVERYRAPDELRSPILTRASRRPLQGIPPRRLDHVNLMASDVTAQKVVLEELLGFGTRETVVDGDVEIAAWMSVNALGHELAVMQDGTGSRGRLHHLAFWYGVPQHNTDFAEVCREYGVRIEAGPDVHGVTQAAFLYVFEPGGNRIELFGSPGILQFEPDYETRVWDLAEFATGGGLAIGGTTMPPEFLLYGTPPAAGQQRVVPPLSRPVGV